MKPDEINSIANLSWCGELHQEAIRATERLVLDEVSVEIRTGASRCAFEVTDAKFKGMRISLIEQQK
ncbi:hypothetical protein [Brucella tritici]|uniref:hypothetical protein n=1 Tax=Brucella tritici TaxID=94626 RepID=UPI001591B7E9|nr:hypothetical protein [Brucella tritici]